MIDTCFDFNLYDAFRLLDTQAKGFIDPFDLRAAFDSPRALDLPHLGQEDIELIFARFDRDQDRRIRFSEFALAFTPLEPYFADKL